MVSGKTYSNLPLPKPSNKFKRKNHKGYTEEEIDSLVKNFIDSSLNIKSYLDEIKLDEQNIFGTYSYSAFRNFIYKELKKRGLKYVSNNKWEFEIIPIK